MQISNDIEKFIKYYMNSICFLGKLQIDAIKRLAQYRGEGEECIYCSFDPNDEDYKEGYVTLYFWTPAVEQDTMVFAENSVFYKYLVEICESFIKEEPQSKVELESYLQQIRRNLNIH